MKPKVLFLMVSTSWVGMALAPYPFPEATQFIGISFGIFLIAGFGAILNHIFDRALDAQMKRTSHRPLVVQSLSVAESITAACLVLLIGTYLLLYYANVLTLLLTLSGSLGYAFIYTLYLKHATPQNITIGGLYGALPPLLGWVAVSHNLDSAPWLLVSIIFIWTPPHFWALALDKAQEYQQANIPMLPVTHGVLFTTQAILMYTVLLFPVCLLPYLTGLLSIRYAVVAIALNSYYFWINIQVYRRVASANKASFMYSIVYLYALFFTMLLDRFL